MNRGAFRRASFAAILVGCMLAAGPAHAGDPATAEQLDEEDLTERSMLTMAAAEEDYLLNADYERRKRELENVANAIR